MTGAVAIRRAHVTAHFDTAGVATLSELELLRYVRPATGLPPHVRAASGLRRFANRLIVVQDDVNALGVVEARRWVRPVLLPPHGSGERAFDDVRGNTRHKLDLEACVALTEECFVALGSGSTPEREQLVVWNGCDAPVIMSAARLYGDLRAAVTRGSTRLNIEGAVVTGEIVRLFHRGNDARDAVANAIVTMERAEFIRFVAGRGASPRIVAVTTVDLGNLNGVPFGFTDAVAVDGQHVVVLACAEDSTSAIKDGAVLGVRVGVLDDRELRLVDDQNIEGAPTRLKLEGIEVRDGADEVFDVVIDVDQSAAPAQLGRLAWKWR